MGIETEAHPFSGTPIIPRRINHMSFELESDRATKLKDKYQNANMGRDITWDIVIKADIRGVKYDGKISVKSASDKTNVVVDIKKGSESVVQLKSEVQVKGTKFRLRSKYSIMGGKVAQGDFKANYQNNKLTFEAPPYKLEVELHLGRSIKVEASKNGESMWTYETLREDKSNPNAIVWEANSKMTLNPPPSCTSSSRTTIPSALSRPGPTTSSSSSTDTTGTSCCASSRSTSTL